MSADSLKGGLPTALRVIPSDQNKENTVPGSVKEEQGNIVLSKEVQLLPPPQYMFFPRPQLLHCSILKIKEMYNDAVQAGGSP